MSTSIREHAPVTSRWRVVDIVVAAVLAVASGVVFWLWDFAWAPIAALLAFLAPLSGLLNGGWLLGGTLGALVIRKPGAAVFCELVAAAVEATLGSQWGMSVFISGLVQGLAVEIVFAAFGYRRWNIGTATLAGAAAGLACGLRDVFFGSYVTWESTYKAIYTGCSIVSGALLAGFLAWYVVRALAATGALAPFASGRVAREV